MTSFKKVISLGIFVWLMVPNGFSQGGLMVTPQRVIFEGRIRTQFITLVNKGKSTQTYRLFFTEKRMTEAGLLIGIDASENGLFASPLVRFSPRQVTLDPGQSQKVILLLRPHSQLTSGEYRSHLVFQVVPETGGHKLEVANGEGGGLGVQLTPLIGASIPVIVRRGDLTTKVEIAKANLEKGQDHSPAMLNLTFRRIGNRSVYGDIEVQFIPNGGQVSTVGFVKGMAIYTNLEKRTITFPLHPTEYTRLERGKLRVVYTAGHSRNVLATYEFAL